MHLLWDNRVGIALDTYPVPFLASFLSVFVCSAYRHRCWLIGSFHDMAMLFAITSPVLVWGGFVIAQYDLSYTPGLRIICVLGHLPPKSQMWLLQTHTSLMFIGTPLLVSSVSSFGLCGLRIAGLLTRADSVSGCTWQDGMPVSKSNFCDDDTF